MDQQNKSDYGLLSLTLRIGDSVTIGDSLVTVSQIKGKSLRLIFNAPKNVSIKRTKLLDRKVR